MKSDLEIESAASPPLRRSLAGHNPVWHHRCFQSRRPIAPAFVRPNPAEWSDNRITAAWLGHATVLINFFGIKILTDPVLFPRIGIRLPGLTLGPKRLTASALTVRDLPKIDIVLLSHAHFDHFDMRTLHRFDRSTTVITAWRTSDLLRCKRFRDVSELRWKEIKSVTTFAGKIDIVAFRVKHWGARTRRDTYRGYNGYVLERNNRRIIFSCDTALSDSFAELRASDPVLRQRLLELRLDTEGVGGRACPEYCARARRGHVG